MIGWFFLGDEPFSHRRRSGGPFANMVVEGSRGLRGFGPSGWCDAMAVPIPEDKKSNHSSSFVERPVLCPLFTNENELRQKNPYR